MENTSPRQAQKGRKKRKTRAKSSSSTPETSEQQAGPPGSSSTPAEKDAAHARTTMTGKINNDNDDDDDEEQHIREAFERYYLRKIADEFSDDLDALRSADDFTGDEASLAMLMTALKQGVDGFSLAEQRVVVQAAERGREGAGRD